MEAFYFLGFGHTMTSGHWWTAWKTRKMGMIARDTLQDYVYGENSEQRDTAILDEASSTVLGLMNRREMKMLCMILSVQSQLSKHAGTVSPLRTGVLYTDVTPCCTSPHGASVTGRTGWKEPGMARRLPQSAGTPERSEY